MIFILTFVGKLITFLIPMILVENVVITTKKVTVTIESIVGPNPGLVVLTMVPMRKVIYMNYGRVTDT